MVIITQYLFLKTLSSINIEHLSNSKLLGACGETFTVIYLNMFVALFIY